MPLFDANKALRKAKGLARKGDVDAAAELYASVLEKFPKNNQAIKGLASIQRGRKAETQEFLEQNLQYLVRIFKILLRLVSCIGFEIVSTKIDQCVGVQNPKGVLNFPVRRLN